MAEAACDARGEAHPGAGPVSTAFPRKLHIEREGSNYKYCSIGASPTADGCEMSKTASTSFFGKIGWREICPCISMWASVGLPHVVCCRCSVVTAGPGSALVVFDRIDDDATVAPPQHAANQPQIHGVAGKLVGSKQNVNPGSWPGARSNSRRRYPVFAPHPEACASSTRALMVVSMTTPIIHDTMPS